MAALVPPFLRAFLPVVVDIGIFPFPAGYHSFGSPISPALGDDSNWLFVILPAQLRLVG